MVSEILIGSQKKSLVRRLLRTVCVCLAIALIFRYGAYTKEMVLTLEVRHATEVRFSSRLNVDYLVQTRNEQGEWHDQGDIITGDGTTVQTYLSGNEWKEADLKVVELPETIEIGVDLFPATEVVFYGSNLYEYQMQTTMNMREWSDQGPPFRGENGIMSRFISASEKHYSFIRVHFYKPEEGS